MNIYQTALKTTNGIHYGTPSNESTTKTQLLFVIKPTHDTTTRVDAQVIFRKPVSSACHASEIKNRFRQLADQWSNDTLNLSSITEMITHPAYLRIIGLGAPATGLLLQELESNPDYWFFALSAVTNQDPTTNDDQGDFDEMRNKWLQWGQARHYI